MTTNSLLTINMITRAAVALWKNSNAFIQAIDTQYDDSYAKTGAKIGAQLRIRLPNDYTVTDGPALGIQTTNEVNTVLTLGTQRHVDVSFNSVDRALSLDDYVERVMSPAINNLAGNVAYSVMSNCAEAVCNFTANNTGPGTATLSPTIQQAFNARALLAAESTPLGTRKFVLDPLTMARAAGSASGLFNPASAISKQYETGMVFQSGGFDWTEDQTVLLHQTGTFSATANSVNGAGQTGSAIVVAATTGTLAKGDIITVAGVHAVNHITKAARGALRSFVVTAPVPAGSTSIPIYPAIVPPVQIGGAFPGQTGYGAQYQTVDVSPANGAVISLINLAGEQYRKNLAFDRKAITMATADLFLPTGVIEANRRAMDGVSMRIVSQYLIGTDEATTRVDVLFGSLAVKPEWAVVVGDSI